MLLVKDNARTILKLLLKRLDCSYDSNIYYSMIEHPYFPSFLSLQHGLKYAGIDSLAIKTNLQQLKNDLPKPILVRLETNVELFLLIDSIDDKGVHFINEKGGTDFEAIDNFVKMWDGNAMIFDTENMKSIPKPLINSLKNILESIRKPFILSSTSLIILFFILSQKRDVQNYLYLLFSSIGIMLSVLLFIQHIDINNPFIQRICSSKKNPKVSCTSILNSRGAYFIGIFSWSDIGLVFFLFIFVVNLMCIPIAYSISAILSALAFPYIFYSIIYQKFIARNWCRLCIGVQVAIAALFSISAFGYSQISIHNFWQPHYILEILLIVMIIITFLLIIKPLLKSSLDEKNLKIKFKQLKHTDEVIQLLLEKQHATENTSGCALLLGNPEGDTVLTLAVNPTCNPCVNELTTLLPILMIKENVRTELLFVVDTAEDRLSTKLAEVMISKYMHNAPNFFKVINDYVSSYPVSKHRYSKEEIPSHLSNDSTQMLNKQQEWAKRNRVLSTPQIFINHKRIPEFYTAKDIDYLCS